ncbi:RNA polymerase sigma factor [Paenibacillaceae bacterium]|nr:RNA polymerase sigma factor [Paenibacillaceae bacterium]
MEHCQKRENVESFHRLYSRYFKQVYHTAFSITKDRELAQDAVQETFLKAYRNLDSLEKHDKEEAWLKTISRNVAIDMYRKRCREMRIYSALLDDYRGETDVERTIVDQVFLRSLLASLEPINRQAMLLVYAYGLTYEQLADCQQTSISAARSRVHRAKEKLRGLVM